eukprot:GFUD01025912.1.p1 GENE.GFUD01025912.1~~GFUD01025912.1.p1  ORF type:complete len:697 (+),score=162.50 GFUD01025912.1:64-2154(+)
MIQLCIVLLGLSVGIICDNQDFVPSIGRGGKSLTDTFPFSLQEDDQHLGHDLQVDNDLGFDRGSRQNEESAQSVPFSDVASSYAGGKRCIDKVFMEEITEWDTQYTCQHSYNRRCAKSLTTTYNAAQEEECEENYVKKCFIEYTAYAQNVTVNVCRTPLVKDCDQQGEELCTTEYESECVTEQLEHQVEDDVPECQTVVDEKCEDITSGYTSSQQCSKWPREECVLSKQNRKKYSPQTRCEKIPVTLCGPAGCGLVEGDEVCYERTQTIVGDKPEETCSLDPQITCRYVTKLVPQLKEVENCFDVPKEVCVREEVNPRKVAKPVIKRWCYVVSCPEECVEAAKEGQCPAQCKKEHEGNSRCCAPCSLTCQNAARNDQCPRECTQYEGNTKCCGGCSEQCKKGVKDKKTMPECEQYRGNEECYYETQAEECEECQPSIRRGECSIECYLEYGLGACCPTCPNICKQFAREEQTYKNATLELDCSDFEDKSCYFECPKRCVNAFKKGETRQDCEKYSYLEDCYKPPPCSRGCLEAAKNEQCPRECEKYEGNRKCCNGCPSECGSAFGQRRTLEKCRKYSMEFDQCFYEECPSKCMDEAKKGKCPSECKKYAGNPNCCIRSDCPVECQEKSLWGECPAQCKQFAGNPDCCAATCPAKCTNKRRKECSGGGVAECDGIPGCCPEKFDVIFGPGVFLKNEE